MPVWSPFQWQRAKGYPLIRLWLAAVLLIPSLAYAEISAQSTAPQLSEASKRLLIGQLLHESGVQNLLRQLPIFIELELRNLEASSMPFSVQELARLREQLETRFSVPEIRRQVSERLLQTLDAQALTTLRDLLQQPTVEHFRALQAAMDSDDIRADIRDYRLLMRERQPQGARVELLDSLNRALHYTPLEIELKVELRKSLLANASWLKSQEIIPESLLERELASYRQRVTEQTEADARLYFLFMFKHTPSEQLSQLVRLFEHPLFAQFMQECQYGMQEMFREARAATDQLQRDLTVILP